MTSQRTLVQLFLTVELNNDRLCEVNQAKKNSASAAGWHSASDMMAVPPASRISPKTLIYMDFSCFRFHVTGQIRRA
jgi:hypothetical protein